MPAVTPERQQIERLVRGEHHEPHRLLGAHLDGDRVTIRAWRPDATGVVALIGDDRVTLTKIHPAGLFEVVLPRSDIPAYRLEVAYGDRSFTIDDPYRFLADHRRARRAPGRRGHPRAALGEARRPRADRRRRGRDLVRGLGAQRPRRCGWWATSTPGTAGCTRCDCSALPGCGSCSCPVSPPG